MGYTSWLFLLTVVIIPTMIYFGRNEKLGTDSLVWVGLGLVGIAAVSVLVGYVFGVEKAVAHSDPVYALLSYGIFFVAWPFARWFFGTVNDPSLKK